MSSLKSVGRSLFHLFQKQLCPSHAAVFIFLHYCTKYPYILRTLVQDMDLRGKNCVVQRGIISITDVPCCRFTHHSHHYVTLAELYTCNCSWFLWAHITVYLWLYSPLLDLCHFFIFLIFLNSWQDPLGGGSAH
jgi:hypothetical protein